MNYSEQINTFRYSHIIHSYSVIPGDRNGNPLQYSCPENPTDQGAWGATVHGVAKSWTRLSDKTHAKIKITLKCILIGERSQS